MTQMASSDAAPAAQLAPGHKLCGSCGAQILVRAEICPKCGVRQRTAVSKAALLLFTFFTGGIGGHKFYLGKHWQGIFYLVFFWTGIPALIALVEFFVYIFTSSERLNEKYSGTSAGLVVALVVVAVVGVMMIGILAAVAIPASKTMCSVLTFMKRSALRHRGGRRSKCSTSICRNYPAEWTVSARIWSRAKPEAGTATSTLDRMECSR